MYNDKNWIKILWILNKIEIIFKNVILNFVLNIIIYKKFKNSNYKFQSDMFDNMSTIIVTQIHLNL